MSRYKVLSRSSFTSFIVFVGFFGIFLMKSASASELSGMEKFALEGDSFKERVMPKLNVLSAYNLRKTSRALKNAVDRTPSWNRLQKLVSQETLPAFMALDHRSQRVLLRGFTERKMMFKVNLVDLSYTDLEKYHYFMGMLRCRGSASANMLTHITNFFVARLAPQKFSLATYKAVVGLGIAFRYLADEEACICLLRTLSEMDPPRLRSIAFVASEINAHYMLSEVPKAVPSNSLSHLVTHIVDMSLIDPAQLPDLLTLYKRAPINQSITRSRFFRDFALVAPEDRERVFKALEDLADGTPYFADLSESLCPYNMEIITKISSRAGDLIRHICNNCLILLSGNQLGFNELFDTMKRIEGEDLESICTHTQDLIPILVDDLSEDCYVDGAVRLFSAVADLPLDSRGTFCAKAKDKGSVVQKVNYLQRLRK